MDVKASPSSSSPSLFMTTPCTSLAGKNPQLCQLLKQQRRFCCSQDLLLLGNLPCSFFLPEGKWMCRVLGVNFGWRACSHCLCWDQWPFHCPGLYCTENKHSFHGSVNTNTSHTPKSDSHVLQRTEKLPCLNLKTSGRGGWDYLTFKIFYKYYVNQIWSE